ncbi:hypothetical protein [Halegenticoccus tardaugens]|uniref:hypothetical protein n=1 Tax=Halegenticoccus tardaugens TaxID=2071624 RepID=UPI0013E96F3F|nr:hypothetical protein [Halegenticoccus tardaugens]
MVLSEGRVKGSHAPRTGWTTVEVNDASGRASEASEEAIEAAAETNDAAAAAEPASGGR